MAEEERLALRLTVAVESWPLKWPFFITGHVFHASEIVVATLSDGEHVGRGEAAGVYYHGDTPKTLAAGIEAVRREVEAGITRDELARLLPPGGVRNALDSALWDLEASRAGRSVLDLAGVCPAHPLLTTCTVSAGEPDAMAASAKSYLGARAIKLKLLGDGRDGARVSAVRAACANVYLAVDANQGFTPVTLDAVWPTFVDCRVDLVEQPFPIGLDHLLDGRARSIPIAADESAQSLADIAGLRGRYDVVNIKLDKSGGLTEGLAMAREAKRLGMKVMVGNMTGTSLAMAPAFVLGQLCDVVDLDGPMFLSKDRDPGVVYEDGYIGIPRAFWGGVTA
jgi:L-alanine-DL-glutamate epimerase-like enolase superfamily enzyme